VAPTSTDSLWPGHGSSRIIDEMMNMACVALSGCRLLSGCLVVFSGCLLLLPAKPHHATPVPASQASPRQRYHSRRDDDYLTSLYLPTPSWKRGFFVLCGYAPRATVENLSRHAKDCTALPSRDRGSQSFPAASERAPACRRGLIACSSYPRLACLEIIVFRAVLPLPYLTVPLPISLARNIEGSLSLLI
jgi:hypothetical protein